VSMGYERSGVAVVPQRSWEPLFSGNGTALQRCASCQGYADPTATHSDCTIRGIRKAGYAGACKKRKPRTVTITPTRKDMSMKSTGPFVCTPCHLSFVNPQALGAHRRHTHPKVERPVPEVSTSGAVDCSSTPTPNGSAHVFTPPNTNGWQQTPHRMADIAIPDQQVAQFEAEADEFAQSVTVGTLLAMARAEIAELRIELMMLALTDKLGDDAEAFAASFIFPAVEAAERAAEVAA